jgi:FtsH-binding integral membrane protein
MASLTATRLTRKQRDAFLRRDRNSGWLSASLQCLVFPFSIYYAITRRTITPILWSTATGFVTTFTGCLALAFVVMATNGALSPKEAGSSWQFQAVLAAGGICGMKAGMDKANAYAKKRLEEG